MIDVSVEPFEIEARTRHSDLVHADVYLPLSITEHGRSGILGEIYEHPFYDEWQRRIGSRRSPRRG